MPRRHTNRKAIPYDSVAPIETLSWFFNDALQRVSGFEGRLYRKDARRLLEQKIAHLDARSKIGGAHPARLMLLAKEMLNGRYLKYSTKGSLVDDVSRCCRANMLGRV